MVRPNTGPERKHPLHDIAEQPTFCVFRVSEILVSEEQHVDCIETQLELIIKIGVENYIQLQSQPAG